MEKKVGLIFGGIFLFSLVLVVGFVMAAAADTQTASATVTVNEFVSITLIDAGDAGVIFGSKDPNTNNNPDVAQDTAQVTPAISVKNEAVSNVDVNVDVKGTAFGGSPSGSMAVGQATYDDDGTLGEGTEVDQSDAVLLIDYPGTPYYSAIAPDSSVGFWFFLDIPTGQTAATYTSTFTFQGSS